MNTIGIAAQRQQRPAPGTAAILAAPACREDGRAPRRRSAGWLSLLAGAGLLLSTGCSMLGLTPSSSETSVHSVDPNVPFVVVTVGGASQGTADARRRRDDP